jgi:hypothetical protein
MILAVWETLMAIAYGCILEPWIQYTPYDEHKKKGDKEEVVGLIDGNRACQFQKIVRQGEKIPFIALMQDMLLGGLTNHPIPPKMMAKVGSIPLCVHVKAQLATRRVYGVYYKPTFEWSGKTPTGKTVFGLGEDWPLFQKRWNDCKGDECKVSELYGKTPYGQPVFTPINVLEQARKGIREGFDMAPIVQRGRGKSATVEAEVNEDVIIATMEENSENLKAIMEAMGINPEA